MQLINDCTYLVPIYHLSARLIYPSSFIIYLFIQIGLSERAGTCSGELALHHGRPEARATLLHTRSPGRQAQRLRPHCGRDHLLCHLRHRHLLPAHQPLRSRHPGAGLISNICFYLGGIFLSPLNTVNKIYPQNG